jgi:hypothetical protein
VRVGGAQTLSVIGEPAVLLGGESGSVSGGVQVEGFLHAVARAHKSVEMGGWPIAETGRPPATSIGTER